MVAATLQEFWAKGANVIDDGDSEPAGDDNPVVWVYIRLGLQRGMVSPFGLRTLNARANDDVERTISALKQQHTR